MAYKLRKTILILLVILLNRNAVSDEIGESSNSIFDAIYSSSIVSIHDYVQYLSGDEINQFDNISCLHLKLDYLKIANKSLEDGGGPGWLQYYYQNDLITWNCIFCSPSEKDFKKEIKDFNEMIVGAKKPRGQIPNDSLYIAAMIRLFDKYEISLGENYISYDFSNELKCKDFKTLGTFIHD